MAGDLLPPPLSFGDQPVLKRHSSVPSATGRNLPNYWNLDFAVVGPSVQNLESTGSGFERPPTQPNCQSRNMGLVGMLVAEQTTTS